MAVLGFAFVAQKRSEQQKVVAAPKVAVQAASPRPVSEHNWAKHSLDTTNKVIRQVAQQRYVPSLAAPPVARAS